MAKTFSYAGVEIVGEFVAEKLSERGWEKVDDYVDADVVFTYFLNSGALEDAYFDENGIVKRALEGTMLFDMSPSTPSLARELGAVCTVNGLRFVEAPIVVHDSTRAKAFAVDNVECFIAADEEDLVEEAEGVLEALTAIATRSGGYGTAQLAKSACTSQIVAQVMSAVESAAIFGAITESSIAPGCTPLAALVLAAIEGNRFEGDFTVEMMLADVVSALTAADDAEMVLPHLEAAMHMLEMLAVIGGADKAPAALSLLYCDEKTCTDQGLDWSRAEKLYSDGGTQHAHEHAHDPNGIDLGWGSGEEF